MQGRPVAGNYKLIKAAYKKERSDAKAEWVYPSEPLLTTTVGNTSEAWSLLYWPLWPCLAVPWWLERCTKTWGGGPHVAWFRKRPLSIRVSLVTDDQTNCSLQNRQCTIDMPRKHQTFLTYPLSLTSSQMTQKFNTLNTSMPWQALMCTQVCNLPMVDTKFCCRALCGPFPQIFWWKDAHCRFLRWCLQIPQRNVVWVRLFDFDQGFWKHLGKLPAARQHHQNFVNQLNETQREAREHKARRKMFYDRRSKACLGRSSLLHCLGFFFRTNHAFLAFTGLTWILGNSILVRRNLVPNFTLIRRRLQH